jgi:uncharacterized membrane protein (UPF0127 family)
MTSRVSFRNIFFVCIALSVVSACGAEGQTEKKDLIIISSGIEVPVKAEIARTEAERALGLMHRKELKDGSGMLFIFEEDQPLSFWMKNTLIPLSIAFIGSDGLIHEIRDMQPKSLISIQSAVPARYALEVPRGWFSRAGISPGSRLVISGF